MEDSYMLTLSKWMKHYLFIFILFFPVVSIAAAADSPVILYTTYTRVAVPPGETLDYPIAVMNKSNKIQYVDISVSGIPKGWNYVLKGSGKNVEQYAILPNENISVNLQVEVPWNANKGYYRFRVSAGKLFTLPLGVTISEQGTFTTEFTTRQKNMQGHAGASFTFNSEIKNRTAESHSYGLRAQSPRGWSVVFKADYKQVTSVQTDPNSTTPIVIDVKSPERIEAGTYKIPVSAVFGTASADLELEVVITGSYNVELTTPTGRVSANITAGEEKRIELIVRNRGTSGLNDIRLNNSAPSNWEVAFEPKKVDFVAPGDEAKVDAFIKADKKAIAGDYIVNLEALLPETSSRIQYRMSVKTPMLWGWIGVLIIFIALGSVLFLFRKYGRR